MSNGCSALCQSLFPLQHLQLGVSRAPQGRPGQGGCNGGLVPTAIFPFPICAAKVAPASWAIVLTVCKKEIKTSLFSRHEQQRNNKKERKKNKKAQTKTTTTKKSNKKKIFRLLQGIKSVQLSAQSPWHCGCIPPSPVGPHTGSLEERQTFCWQLRNFS